MRRITLASVLVAAMAAAGSDAAQAPSAGNALAVARTEWQAAERETKRLEAASAKSADEASKLALQRQAAASSIGAAEALVSAASAELALRRMAVAEARGRLAEKQQPVAALVAGLKPEVEPRERTRMGRRRRLPRRRRHRRVPSRPSAGSRATPGAHHR